MAQLFRGQDIGVARQFRKHQPSALSQHPCDGRDAGCRIGYLAEHRREKGDIEGGVAKRQSSRAGLRGRRVPHACLAQAAPCATEHLQLDVDQLQPSPGRRASHRYTEETGTRADLEHSRRGCELQVRHEL